MERQPLERQTPESRTHRPHPRTGATQQGAHNPAWHPLNAGSILALQRSVGNAAVSRVLDEEQHALGGHGQIEDRAGGRIKEKPTNDVERGFYADMRADKHPRLNGVVPNSYTAEQVEQMDGVKGAGSDATHIYIDNLTFGMTSPKVLDIKVGKSTASKRELLTAMSNTDARLKKLKMKFADTVTGSASRGFRAVGGSGLKGKSRRAIGQQSGQIVRDLSSEPSVYDELVRKLTQVRSAARESGLAFIAASVLIAVDEQPAAGGDAETVRVKLIDFAHTFDQERMSADQVRKYQKRFDEGMAQLIETVRGAGQAAETRAA